MFAVEAHFWGFLRIKNYEILRLLPIVLIFYCFYIINCFINVVFFLLTLKLNNLSSAYSNLLSVNERT